MPSLSAVLKACRKKNPKAELVAPSLRKSKTGKTKFLNWRTIKNAMKKALKKCGLKPMTFYQAGRHTFRSGFSLGTRSTASRRSWGTSSVQVIERYAHLRNQLKGCRARARADVTLAPGARHPMRRSCASATSASASPHVAAPGPSRSTFVELRNTIVACPSARSARTFGGESSM